MAAAKLPKKERTQMDAIDAIEKVIDDRRRLDYVLEHRAGGVGDQAATQYARLTEENAELVKQGGIWVAESLRLTEENRVLREALEDIDVLSTQQVVHERIDAALVKGDAK